MRNYRLFVTFILLFSVLLAFGSAQRVLVVNAQSDVDTAHIAGQVTDLSGDPVEGVRAAAYQYNPDLAGWFSLA